MDGAKQSDSRINSAPLGHKSPNECRMVCYHLRCQRVELSKCNIYARHTRITTNHDAMRRRRCFFSCRFSIGSRAAPVHCLGVFFSRQTRINNKQQQRIFSSRPFGEQKVRAQTDRTRLLTAKCSSSILCVRLFHVPGAFFTLKRFGRTNYRRA